ncbi:MAG: [protein-PII] uridylyltransferase [Hyphomonadaceae bacterium]|jgi:[protein-PII] uridylyltransferase|nr:[protein-PII] uridylyltransferase [Hyphomonadaceae bacterium]
MTQPVRLRLKPWKIEDVVDGRALRVRLTSAFLDNMGHEAAARSRVLDLLKGAMLRGRLIAQERLEAGTGGLDCSRLLAAVQDEVIGALYDFTTTHIFRARNPTTAERLAVCATGGYGRYALAPSSDVDLLFIRPARDAPWAESVIEYMLYMLWDMGLKVGHASRTIAECLRAAREDMTIRTSVLETRLIVGDAALAEELSQRLRQELFRGTETEFITAKLEEREKRHTRAGESRYMVEPNVKDGKGGLRDLHTMFWIAKYLHGVDAPREFVAKGIFSRKEIQQFLQAAEFFWTVRCHLHFLTGRAEDKLTFDLQPEMARRMGYGTRPGNPAVERFMKHYFVVSKQVGTLTRILSAKLEAGQRKATPWSLARLLSSSGGQSIRKLGDGRFQSVNNRVGFVSPADAVGAPLTLLELFKVADHEGKDIDPAALALVVEHGLALRGLRRTAGAQAVFLDIVASPNNPARALSLMNETGALGRFVPEFGRIVGQTQFNMYHHYTVDEHTLMGIATLSQIEHGELHKVAPICTSVFPKIVHRRALFLAMLLHDVGKGEGDQQIEGAKAARAVCKRLDLDEEETDLVAWLVGHHLVMSDTAQKRDLGDPDTVARFAEIVGTLERLRLLLVLTVADIRAVGPGVWNDWKAQLLRDLYQLTEATLRGGRTDEASVRRLLAERAAGARADLLLEPHVRDWFEGIEDAYWLGFDSGQHHWHAEEVRKALQEGDATRVAMRHDPVRGTTDILLLCPDRPGLMRDLAMLLAQDGISIVDARIHTSASGQAFDVFAVQDSTGGSLAGRSAGALDDLKGRILRTLPAGLATTVSSPAPVNRRLAAFAIEPRVTVHNDASASDSVIEISCRDGIGVLARIAGELQSHGLTITSAMVSSVGERAEDAFYVRTASGGKLTDPKSVEGLQTALANALGDLEPAPPTLAARRKLAKARASGRR